eukprot:1161696-Pelagomonas_calceolata.AAC.28
MERDRLVGVGGEAIRKQVHPSDGHDSPHKAIKPGAQQAKRISDMACVRVCMRASALCVRALRACVRVCVCARARSCELAWAHNFASMCCVHVRL